MTEVLILPGLYDSGPEHWQSHWVRRDPRCRRVEQADWFTPHLGDWVSTLDDAVAALDGAALLVAHSSSCGLVARWAAAATPERLARICGALLVAPTDPEAPSFPAGPLGFAPMSLAPLPFPSVVVASTDDEYVSVARAREFAAAWGSELVEVGAKGHINTASALGEWPEGLALLERLRARGTAPAR